MTSKLCKGWWIGKYSNSHDFDGEWNGIGMCPNCNDEFKKSWVNQLTKPNQIDMSFDNFDNNDKLVERIKKYCVSLAKGDKNSLIMWSSRCGTGKTHMAISIAKEYINSITERCIPVKMITESELMDKIRATYGNNENNETESLIIADITSANLVIVDDVGKVTSSNMDFVRRIYFLIIDRLYTMNKPVIITSNLGLVALSGHIGEACVSRLYEMTKGNIIEFIGKDYRFNYKGEK